MNLCEIHEIPYTHICVHHGLRRVCEKCMTQGECKDHQTSQISSLVDYYINRIQLAEKLFAEGKKRHQQLTQMSSNALALKKQNQDRLLSSLVNAVRDETKRMKVQRRKIIAMQKQIQHQLRVRSYFTQLKENNLLELKMKVASKKGLIDFRDRMKQLNGCTTKWQLEETKRMAGTLFEEYEVLRNMQLGSVVTKLKTYMGQGSKVIRREKESI